MTYSERYRSMTKEQIKAEKEGVLIAMKILLEMRQEAIKQETEKPGSVKQIPDTSYTLLNYLVTCVPADFPMPYSFKEFDEYTAIQKINLNLGPMFKSEIPGIGSEGAPKQSEK